MELSKALLGALLIGISVEVSSCAKPNDNPTPLTEKPGDGTTQQPSNIDPCPACGMG